MSQLGRILEPNRCSLGVVGVIPQELDHMEPGPQLGQILARIDLSALSGHDRLVVLRACQRMASHYQAKTYQAMTSISNLICEQDRGVM